MSNTICSIAKCITMIRLDDKDMIEMALSTDVYID